jgi:hypothetical protein
VYVPFSSTRSIRPFSIRRSSSVSSFAVMGYTLGRTTLPCNRKPQTAAAELPRRRPVRPAERLEQLPGLLWRHADSRIANSVGRSM